MTAARSTTLIVGIPTLHCTTVPMTYFSMSPGAVMKPGLAAVASTSNSFANASTLVSVSPYSLLAPNFQDAMEASYTYSHVHILRLVPQSLRLIPLNPCSTQIQEPEGFRKTRLMDSLKTCNCTCLTNTFDFIKVVHIRFTWRDGDRPSHGQPSRLSSSVISVTWKNNR